MLDNYSKARLPKKIHLVNLPDFSFSVVNKMYNVVEKIY